MSYGISAEKAMNARPITITKDKTLSDAAKHMLKNRVGSLLVVESGNLIGIITDTDIVRELAVGGKTRSAKVEDSMTHNLITVSPETDLYDVARTMVSNDVRRLPVVDSARRLLGLITEKDLIRVQPSVMDVLMDTMVRMNSRYDVELSEGVGAEKVIDTIKECMEKAKSSDRTLGVDLQGIRVEPAGALIERQHPKPKAIIAVSCLHPYSLVAFNDVVVPLVSKTLKIKRYIK